MEAAAEAQQRVAGKAGDVGPAEKRLRSWDYLQALQVCSCIPNRNTMRRLGVAEGIDRGASVCTYTLGQFMAARWATPHESQAFPVARDRGRAPNHRKALVVDRLILLASLALLR